MVVNRQQLHERRRILWQEDRGIRRLKERAKEHKKGLDDAGKEALATFMETSEVGERVRKRNMAAAKEALDAESSTLKARTRALSREWRALQRKAMSRENAASRLAMHIIESVVTPGPPAPPPEEDLDAWTDGPETLPHVVAHGALYAWILDVAGLADSAEKLRRDVLEMSDGGERSAPYTRARRLCPVRTQRCTAHRAVHAEP